MSLRGKHLQRGDWWITTKRTGVLIPSRPHPQAKNTVHIIFKDKMLLPLGFPLLHHRSHGTFRFLSPDFVSHRRRWTATNLEREEEPSCAGEEDFRVSRKKQEKEEEEEAEEEEEGGGGKGGEGGEEKEKEMEKRRSKRRREKCIHIKPHNTALLQPFMDIFIFTGTGLWDTEVGRI